MKRAEKYRISINVLMNLFVSIGIAVVCLTIASMQTETMLVTPLGVFNIVLCTFVIGYTIGDTLPLMDWGMKVASVLKVGQIGSRVVSSTVLGFCMGLFIGLTAGYIMNNAAGIDAVLGFYSANLAIIIISAIIFVNLLNAPVQKLSAWIAGFDQSLKEEVA